MVLNQMMFGKESQCEMYISYKINVTLSYPFTGDVNRYRYVDSVYLSCVVFDVFIFVCN